MKTIKLKKELPKQVLDLGAHLYANYKMPVDVAFNFAEELITFNSMLEKIIKKYKGIEGVVNKEVEITGKLYPSFPESKAVIHGTLKRFKLIDGIDKPVYFSVFCSDNKIYCEGKRYPIKSEHEWDFRKIKKIKVLE